ncbi:ankyrin repeat-containing protein ITN1-like [Mercurialis annua]|uniref:ankyrin repeat-containing protein ITN1-like n=1 Tax=Mercurialis annua TaxID=3986 RepID=UPI00215F616D|nr:ankyrin repeat-containing protein ITN1-like [Mercurialis annua]
MQNREDDMKNLYEASIKGDTSTLNILLQKDPLILHRISLSTFTESPLHISSLLGHADFAKSLLNQKPKLAAELDSQGQSPLHMASAEGNMEIINVLLSINADVCLVPDQNGRIPIHLAVMRGRTEVIQQLIRACPESSRAKTNGGDTVLHLCVKYSHLESLKLLVPFFSEDAEFLNSMDNDGNSVLHLAVIMKQVETIKYLVSIPDIKVEATTLSSIFKEYPINIKKFPSGQNSNNSENGGDWLEKARGNLMVVATVIAGMAFQAAMNPPGGVWESDNKECFTSEGQMRTCKAGTSILAYTDKTRHHQFILDNTISFSASLTTIFLLISGVPLKKKVYIWILLMGMCVALVFTSATYLVTLAAIKAPGDKVVDLSIYTYSWFWTMIVVFVVAFYTFKFMVHFIKKIFVSLFHGKVPLFSTVSNKGSVIV